MNFPFPFPITNYLIKCSRDLSINELNEKLGGPNTFTVNRVFGEKSGRYLVEKDYDCITLTHDVSSSFGKVPVYPSARIFTVKNEDGFNVKIKVTLSVYWKLMFYFFFVIGVFGLTYHLIKSESIGEVFLILSRALIWISVFYGLSWIFHIPESKNLFSIVNGIVRDMDSQSKQVI